MTPFAAIWTGADLRIFPRDLPRAANDLSAGVRYVIEIIEERSWKAHRRYFALVNEAWSNLPEDKARQYPTPTHLRKRCLIKAGYRNTRSIVCSSRAEALRVAAFVGDGDPYAVVLTDGATVIAHTAMSQRGRAMNKETFRKSSEAVLALLADMLDVEQHELERAA